jgi:tetratricopeptide (TPR) repeat protein
MARGAVSGGAACLATVMLAMPVALAHERSSEVTMATAAAGVRFEDPEIDSAIALFEEGDRDGAIKHLKRCVGDPRESAKSPRQHEQWAALGMLQARAGDKPAAVRSLRRVALLKEDSDLPLRAQVLLAAVGQSYHGGLGGSADLGDPQRWLGAVSAVRNEIAAKLRDAGESLGHAVQREQWERVATLLDAGAAHARLLLTIELDREKSRPLLLRHRERLDEASAEVAAAIRQRHAALQKLEQELDRTPNLPRNLEHRGRLQSRIAEEETAIRRMQEARQRLEAAVKSTPAPR